MAGRGQPGRSAHTTAPGPAPVVDRPGCLPAVDRAVAGPRVVTDLRQCFPGVHVFYGWRTGEYTALVPGGAVPRLLAHRDPAVLAAELRRVLAPAGLEDRRPVRDRFPDRCDPQGSGPAVIHALSAPARSGWPGE